MKQTKTQREDYNGHPCRTLQLIRSTPVSYTHLDVYKRQGLQISTIKTKAMALCGTDPVWPKIVINGSVCLIMQATTF